jgi:PKD repeat protein
MKRFLLLVLLLTNYTAFGQFDCKTIDVGIRADFSGKKVRIDNTSDTIQLASKMRPLAIENYDDQPFIFCPGSDMDLITNVPLYNFPSSESSFEWEGPNGLKSSGNVLSLKKINQAMSGEYTLKVKSRVSGCPDTTLIRKYTVLLAIPSIKVSDKETCEGGSVQLEPSNNNGGYVYDYFVKSKKTYQWSGPNNFVSTEEKPTIKNIQISGIYNVTVTYSDFCVGSFQTTTKVDAKKSTPVEAFSKSICLNGQATLSASPSLSGATGKYKWTGPNGFSQEGQQITLNKISKKDIGIYKVIAQFEGGCSNIDSTTTLLEIYSPIYNFTSVAEQCEGETMYFPRKLYWNGDYFNDSTKVTYLWTGPNNFRSTEEAPFIENFNNSLAGEYKFEAIFTGACEAKYNKSFFIRPTDKINLFLEAPLLYVNSGQEVSIRSNFEDPFNGKYKFSWQGPDNFSSDSRSLNVKNFTQTKAGKYTLTLDAPGCKEKSTASVELILDTRIAETVKDLKVFTDSTQQKYCKGSTVRLVAYDNYHYILSGTNYNWTGPNGFTSNKAVAYVSDFNESKSGIYTITASNQYGTATSTVNITMMKAPRINLSDTLKICEGGSGGTPYPQFIPNSFYLQSVNGIYGPVNMTETYEWNGPNNFKSGSRNLVFTNFRKSQEGEYELKVTFSGGCDGVATKKIQVIESKPEINWSIDKLCDGKVLITSLLNSQPYSGALLSTRIFNTEGREVRNPIEAKSGDIFNVETNISGQCPQSKQTQLDIKNAKPFSPKIPETITACERGYFSAYPEVSFPYFSELIENTFYQTSVAPNIYYSWTGPNQFSSNKFSIFKYSLNSKDAGIYKLTVKLSGECTGNYEAEMEVKILSGKPIANFDILQNKNTITLQNNTSGDVVDYYWNFGNGSASTSKNPDSVKYITEGKYYIIMDATNECGTSTFSRLITIGSEEKPEEPVKVLSLENKTELLNFTVSPNPSAGMVEISNPNKLDIRLSVYTMDGKAIDTFEIDSNTTSRKYDFSSYASGVYLVKCIQKNGQTITRKIVISK